jgi:hypothetical protein
LGQTVLILDLTHVFKAEKLFASLVTGSGMATKNTAGFSWKRFMDSIKFIFSKDSFGIIKKLIIYESCFYTPLKNLPPE